MSGKTLGDRIRERRIALKLTQEELAEQLGYKSKVCVSKVEGNVHHPGLDIVERYAVALRCSPSYLAGWTDEWEDKAADVLKSIVPPKGKMTVRSLLDTVDYNRERDDVIKVMDGNGEVELWAKTSSHVWDALGNKVIECMWAEAEGVIQIWLYK